MRIVEVIGAYINEETPTDIPLPSQPRSDTARQKQSLLALLYQSLARNGQVIWPGMIGSDFERSDERSEEEDDDWLSGSVYGVSGIAGQ